MFCTYFYVGLVGEHLSLPPRAAFGYVTLSLSYCVCVCVHRHSYWWVNCVPAIALIFKNCGYMSAPLTVSRKASSRVEVSALDDSYRETIKGERPTRAFILMHSDTISSNVQLKGDCSFPLLTQMQHTSHIDYNFMMLEWSFLTALSSHPLLWKKATIPLKDRFCYQKLWSDAKWSVSSASLQWTVDAD